MTRRQPSRPALDRGGWARLDVSDLLPTPSRESSSGDSPTACGWCTTEPARGEYLVIADNRHFRVCPTCWGRSPGYLELRQAGLAHETALARLQGRS